MKASTKGRCFHLANGVLDSRQARPSNRVIADIAGGTTIRRRRYCLACKYRWTTYEVREESIKALAALGRKLDAIDRIMDETAEIRKKAKRLK